MSEDVKSLERGDESDRVTVMLEVMHQPPIDTRASIRHEAIGVVSKALADALRDRDSYTTVRVIGAAVDE